MEPEIILRNMQAWLVNEIKRLRPEFHRLKRVDDLQKAHELRNEIALYQRILDMTKGME